MGKRRLGKGKRMMEKGMMEKGMMEKGSGRQVSVGSGYQTREKTVVVYERWCVRSVVWQRTFC